MEILELKNIITNTLQMGSIAKWRKESMNSKLDQYE